MDWCRISLPQRDVPVHPISLSYYTQVFNFWELIILWCVTCVYLLVGFPFQAPFPAFVSLVSKTVYETYRYSVKVVEWIFQNQPAFVSFQLMPQLIFCSLAQTERDILYIRSPVFILIPVCVLIPVKMLLLSSLLNLCCLIRWLLF